jgi:polysaccharide biosynthesis/export protein PslD
MSRFGTTGTTSASGRTCLGRAARRAPLVVVVATCLGCGSVTREEFDALQRIHVAMAYARKDYRIQPGDTVKLSVFRGAQVPPEYVQELTVQPDGKIALINIEKPLQAEGLTVAELQDKAKEVYAPLFPPREGGTQRFFVTIQFLTTNRAQWLPDQVFVLGQVRRSGAVPYRQGLTVLQAVASAGGWLVGSANESRVVLLRSDNEGKTVTREIDLDAAVSHLGSDLEIFPGDIVYVPMTFISQLNIWIDLWIRGLIPINPSTIRAFLVI